MSRISSSKQLPSRSFKHEFLDYVELCSETTDTGRVYTLPNGQQAHSVTTILGQYDKEWVDEWKARAGAEAAARVSTQASTRGTAVHDLCEKYLRNDPLYAAGHMPVNVANFAKIRPILDSFVSDIYGLEIPLYSTALNTAGRCDLLCKWRNVDSIVDFKTSKRHKTAKDIPMYFLQATAYTLMANEMFGLNITNFAVVMSVDHEDPLVFERSTAPYIEATKRVFQKGLLRA